VLLAKSNGEKTISGERAFYLYDTLGFPLDLTQIMAEEQGLTVNIQEFNKCMNNQKKRSRDINIGKRLDGRIALELGTLDISYLNKNNIATTNDNGKYKNEIINSTIDALFTSEGFVNIISTNDEESFGLLLNSTCFYAESGGQVNDIGKILVISPSTGSIIHLKVLDVQVYGGYILHTCSLSGDDSNDIIQLTTGINVELQVDYNIREKIASNHTMTHVLNSALRSIIGPGLEQKGSLVSEEKIRFDFNYNKSLSDYEINDLEVYINKIINSDLVIDTKEVPLNDGLSIDGVRAVFGEVYPDPVRIVSIGDKVNNLLIKSNSSCEGYSVEFCGGTHLQNTKDAVAFVIIEECAVSKGGIYLNCIVMIY
jgi:alanyl-tRNA synthetase